MVNGGKRRRKGDGGGGRGGGGRASEMGILYRKPTNKTSTTDIIRTLVGIFLCKKKKKIDSARSRSGHAFTVFSSRAIAICTITLYYRTKRGVFFSPLLCFSR